MFSLMGSTTVAYLAVTGLATNLALAGRGMVRTVAVHGSRVTSVQRIIESRTGYNPVTNKAACRAVGISSV
jgi:hypothetical protein